MIAMIQFAGLVFTSIVAAASAVVLGWLFLQATFHLMRPATAKQPAAFRSELVRGTREIARHFGPAALRR